MTTRSALISGAGIAGPVLAFWLTEAGWDVTVVERAERLRTSGYPIDIRGTAIEVVERMGLSTQIAAHRYQHVPLQVLTPGGRRLCRLDLGQLANDAEAGDVEITRGELTRILFDASADRAECLFGDSITALTDTGDGVDVTFSRHGHRRFDVVIGADGIHSKVRALAFGPDARYLHHLDAYVTIWDIDNEMFSPATGYLYSHPGRTLMVERLPDGGAARAYLTFVHPAPGTLNRHNTDQIVAEIRRAFAGDRWRTTEVIDTLPDTEDVYFDTVSQVRMDRWSHGRVALIGDAAYAPAFLSGQGTSIAITGAYVLACELARHTDPEAAFGIYEQRMREHVMRNQELALRNDSTVLPRNRRQLLRRNSMVVALPWLRRLGIDRWLRADLRSAATELSLSPHDLRRSPSRQT
ncbi:FAD-dependent monooxygenase [Mycolicibacterium parafortuitum]|uniref:Oxidoreductase n=1 Tax=Mycolicibacterium parafortuitum TaxID=39692 RepID=A0A375YLW6_MYCPF|nr:FAD-dependent monooxygenase [Mycolicibacterium parafortuitum]ORB30018.1 oxidoreductase [Mycolicibacterium parafortuitum]BBY77397.1 oxidoreductase [Mycolicibacterium parafortuitum]SRX82081.1 oxidoreductase [Streptosporangium roseum DSM] [Mycolicibacterium parafortuitum]